MSAQSGVIGKTSVSADDQQEINEFARVHKRLTEAKVSIKSLAGLNCHQCLERGQDADKRDAKLRRSS